MFLYRIFVVAVLVLCTASPALALTVERSITVNIAPGKAWNVVSDLCSISNWHPSVASCELSQIDGTIFRTMALNPSGTLVDKLVHRDKQHQTVTYELVSSPLPVQKYEATMSIKSTGKGVVITWVGTFLPQKGIPDADAINWVTDIYEDGLNTLSQSLTGIKPAPTP